LEKAGKPVDYREENPNWSPGKKPAAWEEPRQHMSQDEPDQGRTEKNHW